MAETSPNWDLEIIPGAKRVRRGVAAVVDFARFPRSDSYPSDHRDYPGKRGAAVVLDAALDAVPGQVGGVIAEPTLIDVRMEANQVIN